jgi:ATP-dependent Clp protease, protease subunit
MKKNKKLQKKKLKSKPKLNYSRRGESHYENLFEKNVNFKERIIYLNSDIDEDALDLVLKAMDEFERGAEPLQVKVEISSYGGSVYDMLGIIGRLRSSSCHIITRGFGKIMSAATLILAAGDERLMDENAWLMMHEMSDKLKGTMSELEVELKHCRDLESQMYDMYEEFSKGVTKAATFKKLCAGKNHYIDAETTLKLGLVDRITARL